MLINSGKMRALSSQPNNHNEIMKVLTWSVRGISNLRKQIFLKKKIKMEQPEFIFLQETK